MGSPRYRHRIRPQHPRALPSPASRNSGLGSTLVFRRQDLDAIGGFQSIAAYIADDYQLAKRITQLGRRVHLSKTVVETTLGDGATWSGVWNHQLRWARTIRVSRGAYAGLPVTFATLWALAALATPGLALLGGLTLAARFAVAIAAGWGILGSRLVLFYAPFIPLRDLWGVAIWAAGLFGSKVRWRDRSIKLRRDGKIASSRVSKTVDLRR
ncbi:MAG: glycosyltransferase [Bryobacteraceae bacterium]